MFFIALVVPASSQKLEMLAGPEGQRADRENQEIGDGSRGWQIDTATLRLLVALLHPAVLSELS